VTGQPTLDEPLLDEALAWHVALAADDADWDAFTLWLEADPRHRQAYDEIALTDRLVEERKDALRQVIAAPAEPDQSRRFHRRRLMFGSIAAAIALAVGIPTLWPGPADTVYATNGGETRDIALAGGTSINLAPSSRLLVKANDPTNLELVRGEAYFSVVHDPRRILSIRAGNYAVTDIGTKFGVDLTEDSLAIGVSEGHIAVAGNSGDPTRLVAGEQLIARADGSFIRKSSIPAEHVGSWRLGRLVYSDAPLSIVAADITRYSGKTIIVDPSIRNKRFSGVLAIGDGSNLLANLADLMALSYRVEGDRIRVGTADIR
jgi:transmembrane sensor